MAFKIENDELNAKVHDKHELNKNPCRKCRAANKLKCDCGIGAIIYGAVDEERPTVAVSDNDYSDDDFELEVVCGEVVPATDSDNDYSNDNLETELACGDEDEDQIESIFAIPRLKPIGF